MALSDFIDKFGGWTESYSFYDGEIELRYDSKDHVYLLVTPEGLVKQDGVTTVVHIIDKSDALVPWGCKMMYQKLLRTIPTQTMTGPEGGERRYITPLSFEEFEKLAQEAKGAHKEKLEDAGAVGHIAHAWIEDYIKLSIAKKEAKTNESCAEIESKLFAHMAKYPEDERAANACIAALDWMQRHDVRWLGTERKIYSRTYAYAGTMDGLCLCNSCTDPQCCPEPFKGRLSVADWKTSNYLYLEYLFQTAAYEHAYEEEMGVDIKDRWIIRLGKEDGEFEPWHLEEHNFTDDFGGFLDALDLTRRVRRIQERIAAKKAGIREAIKAERDAVKALQEALERKERLEAKEKKQQERLEALALACGPSKTYKGTKPSSCKTNNGKNCETCASKYAAYQAAKGGGPKAQRPSSKIASKQSEAIIRAERLLAVLQTGGTPKGSGISPYREGVSLADNKEVPLLLLPAVTS